MKFSSLKISLFSIISLSVLMLIVALLIYKNSLLTLGAWSESNKLQVFLKPDTSIEEQAQLIKNIKSTSDVESVVVIDRETAGLSFEKSLKEYASGLVSTDELIDLIPISFEISLNANLTESEKLKKSENLINFLKADSAVEEINYSAAWYKKFEKIDNFIRSFGLFVYGIFILLVSYLVSLMLRVYIDDSKTEIEVYNMLGATRWSIYKMYFKDLVYFLIFSFMLATALSYGFFEFVKRSLKDTGFSNLITSRLSFLNFTEFTFLIGRMSLIILAHAFITINFSVHKLNQISHD